MCSNARHDHSVPPAGRPAEPAPGEARRRLTPGRIPGLLGIGLIRLYRLFLSPWLGRHCRYLPTCSSYTEEAIGRYGLWAGSWIGLSRLQRCGPFGASGFDPVPEALPAHARWYLPWRYGHWTGKHIDPRTRLDL